MKLQTVVLSIIMMLSGLSTTTATPYSIDQNDDNLIFPDLDRACVALWLSSDAKDISSSQKNIKSIQDEWVIVKENLVSYQIEHVNMIDFVKRVDSYILSLPVCVEESNHSCLKSIAYHLLYEFRSLRQCLFRTEYPLDVLWDSMDDYFEIKKTINDRMFNLKEWFEFEDDINDFICNWEYYDLKHIDDIHHYYPGIKKKQHSELKDKVNSCIYTLLKSLESGYQSDFVMPCDELGYALDDLLRIYAESRLNMLM